MSLHGGNFLNTIRNFRIAWIGGRFGGGKTAVGTRLAIEFIERGWVKHAVGNFPSVVFTDLHRIGECRDAFIVLDEAGVWLEDRQFDSITAFLRKRNLYVILSSVLPVQLRARTLNIQRVFNGHTLGMNFWLYSGVLDYMRVKEKMNLFWTNPREIFGLYDTTYVTVDSAGITEWIIDAFTEQQRIEAQNPPAWKKYATDRLLGQPQALEAVGGTSRKSPRAASRVDSVDWRGIQSMGEGRRVAEEIAAAADRIEDVVPVLRKAGRRRGR